MTISEALISLNSFPIPSSLIERVGIDRELTITDDYTKTISIKEGFQLAIADVYQWLSVHLDIKEQEVSFSQNEESKKRFASMANDIYYKYGDEKYTGKGVRGFIGENFG